MYLAFDAIACCSDDDMMYLAFDAIATGRLELCASTTT